jgi:hypothetical protein
VDSRGANTPGDCQDSETLHQLLTVLCPDLPNSGVQIADALLAFAASFMVGSTTPVPPAAQRTTLTLSVTLVAGTAPLPPVNLCSQRGVDCLVAMPADVVQSYVRCGLADESDVSAASLPAFSLLPLLSWLATVLTHGTQLYCRQQFGGCVEPLWDCNRRAVNTTV